MPAQPVKVKSEPSDILHIIQCEWILLAFGAFSRFGAADCLCRDSEGHSLGRIHQRAERVRVVVGCGNMVTPVPLERSKVLVLRQRHGVNVFAITVDGAAKITFLIDPLQLLAGGREWIIFVEHVNRLALGSLNGTHQRNALCHGRV